jgi:hypothetical protein
MDKHAEKNNEESNHSKKTDWAISDLVKKAIVSGLGSVFMTEEGIRSYLSEIKLPKEAAQFILGQVTKTKEEMFKVVTAEIRSFLDEIQFDEVLKKLLTGISLELSTKVRFVDESQQLVPETKTKIRLKTKHSPKKDRNEEA